MKLIPTSYGEFIGLNLLSVLLALLLSLCLHANIHTGSILLSCGQGAMIFQGKLEQKIQSPDGVGELHQIGFNDERGDKRHFYQYYPRRRPDCTLGAPLYFYITTEGIVLKNKISGYVFVFILSLIISLMFSVIFVGMLIKLCAHRIECEVRSKKTQRIINLVKWVMFVLSVVGVVLAINRVYADFILPEGKAQVISVNGNDSYRYHVKAFSLSTRTEFEADWHFFNEVSPATGQDVNICYPANSEPVFARHTSDKVYSVVLLIIAFAYMTFTQMVYRRGSTGARGNEIPL